jgi:hypothetical protein
MQISGTYKQKTTIILSSYPHRPMYNNKGMPFPLANDSEKQIPFLHIANALFPLPYLQGK